MNTVLVEVLHDGTGVVEAATLEEVYDEAGGEGDATVGEGDKAGGEGDATVGDAIAGEYDTTAGEDDAAADEGDEAIAAGAVAAEDDVPKMSFCAPSWNPHLLLYAGLFGLPLRSVPLTAMLFPSA